MSHPMRAAVAGALLLVVTRSVLGADGPQPGIPPGVLSEPGYTFDMAEQHKVRAVVVARGLKHPFAIALLPDGDALVSERGGALRRVRNVGATATVDPHPVAGVPPLTAAFRNGGLHDVVLHPQFAQNGWVYFTFNKAGKQFPSADGKAPPRTSSIFTLMRARYANGALSDVQELYAGSESTPSGSRIAFDGMGFVYVSTGGPFGPDAQDLGSSYGKVLRLGEDGKVPKDNPFVGRDGAKPEIWSYGHRDHLGLTARDGQVFNAEHGPNGGDEVNLILPGRNYGWPRISFGHGYDGSPMVDAPTAPGIELPIIYWTPSIGPSGIQFYSGTKFPAWRGNLFVGSVRRGEIPGTGGLERVVLNDRLQELRRETLLTSLHQRIRDVRQGSDGLLYVLTDEDDGALLRLEPANER